MSDPNSSGEQPKASGVAIAVASPAANESNKEWDVNDGKNMGIASKSSLSRGLFCESSRSTSHSLNQLVTSGTVVVLLAIGFIFSFFFPIVSFITTIATIVIASIISCGW